MSSGLFCVGLIFALVRLEKADQQFIHKDVYVSQSQAETACQQRFGWLPDQQTNSTRLQKYMSQHHISSAWLQQPRDDNDTHAQVSDVGVHHVSNGTEVPYVFNQTDQTCVRAIVQNETITDQAVPCDSNATLLCVKGMMRPTDLDDRNVWAESWFLVLMAMFAGFLVVVVASILYLQRRRTRRSKRTLLPSEESEMFLARGHSCRIALVGPHCDTHTFRLKNVKFIENRMFADVKEAEDCVKMKSAALTLGIQIEEYISIIEGMIHKKTEPVVIEYVITPSMIMKYECLERIVDHLTESNCSVVYLPLLIQPHDETADMDSKLHTLKQKAVVITPTWESSETYDMPLLCQSCVTVGVVKDGLANEKVTSGLVDFNIAPDEKVLQKHDKYKTEYNMAVAPGAEVTSAATAVLLISKANANLPYDKIKSTRVVRRVLMGLQTQTDYLVTRGRPRSLREAFFTNKAEKIFDMIRTETVNRRTQDTVAMQTKRSSLSIVRISEQFTNMVSHLNKDYHMVSLGLLDNGDQAPFRSSFVGIPEGGNLMTKDNWSSWLVTFFAHLLRIDVPNTGEHPLYHINEVQCTYGPDAVNSGKYVEALQEMLKSNPDIVIQPNCVNFPSASHGDIHDIWDQIRKSAVAIAAVCHRGDTLNRIYPSTEVIGVGIHLSHEKRVVQTATGGRVDFLVAVDPDPGPAGDHYSTWYTALVVSFVLMLAQANGKSYISLDRYFIAFMQYSYQSRFSFLSLFLHNVSKVIDERTSLKVETFRCINTIFTSSNWKRSVIIAMTVIISFFEVGR